MNLPTTPAPAPLPAYSSPYAGFDAVVIAASLGGPAALGTILARIPTDFPAAILIAQHRAARSAGLTELLAQGSRLPIQEGEAGQPIQPGFVYLAPADHHMLVGGDRRIQLSHSAPVKFCRPAAEPLFVSAATAYRERVLGVVLSGCNTDGAMGTQAIKWTGGRVLAQDAPTSRAFAMPRAAIATGCVDFVLPVERIASALVALVMAPGAAEYLQVPLVA